MGTTAGCLHYLRKVGIVCIMNLTEDLAAPPAEALGTDIRWERLPLQDVEDQDLSAAFRVGLEMIDKVIETGGRVLVHCHEGKSRSVSMCVAYLIVRERLNLKEALAFVKCRRRESNPNAGFMKQLLALELTELGSNSMTIDELPKGKPKGRV